MAVDDTTIGLVGSGIEGARVIETGATAETAGIVGVEETDGVEIMVGEFNNAGAAG